METSHTGVAGASAPGVGAGADAGMGAASPGAGAAAVAAGAASGMPGAPAQLAVFDFDGTSIAGNSPVLLVRHLTSRGMLKPSAVLRIVAWALAYKLRLPQNESWVRSLVFSAFEGRPAAEVDRFLADFYDDAVSPLFRPAADAAMREHARAGHVVVVISATFEPIILRAMQHHPFENQISTRMRVAPDGTYTREVEGLPVEGEQKLVAVTEFGGRALRGGQLGAGLRLRRPPLRPRRALRRAARLRGESRQAAFPHRAQAGLARSGLGLAAPVAAARRACRAAAGRAARAGCRSAAPAGAEGVPVAAGARCGRQWVRRAGRRAARPARGCSVGPWGAIFDVSARSPMIARASRIE